MKFKLYTTDGSSSQDREYTDFPQLEKDKGVQALRDTIVAYQANVRQGNACTKTRAEVKGTGKKPWRQKGTGMARHGSKHSPIWVGGGVAFGPKPRDYSKKINRQVKALAFKRALTDRVAEGAVDLIEALTVNAAKTKLMNHLLSVVAPKGKILLVDKEFEINTVLAARNLARVYVCDADSLNAWDLIRFDRILITEQGFGHILGRVNCE